MDMRHGAEPPPNPFQCVQGVFRSRLRSSGPGPAWRRSESPVWPVGKPPGYRYIRDTVISMMGHEPILPPEFQLGRLPVASKSTKTRQFLLIAAGLSILVHILAALTIAFLPRLLPREPQQQAEGAVELLMVERQGTVASPPAQPTDTKPSPPQPQQQPAPPKTEAPKHKDATEPAPPTEQPSPKDARENAPTAPAEQTEQQPKENKDAAKVAPAPPQPPPQKAPVFDLSGTESESNATVMGGHIIPASKDDRYRNRPPIYPQAAQIRREGGTVDLLIHVTDTGVTGSVDVIASSGHPILDHAAIDAVMKWHFRPALKEGRSVPFDMPFRFEFDPY